jgi:lysozyme
MRINQAGIDLIKEFEGFSATPYVCPAGKLTIGYGHLVRHGETMTTISKEQGETLLRNDLSEAEKLVTSHIRVPLSLNQFSALASLVYNAGKGPLAGTLGKKLNAGDYSGAADQFNRWVYAAGSITPGLLRRRIAEKELFTKEVT